MRTPKTLRSRVVFYFCGYLTILITIFCAALSGLFRLSEDLVFNRQLAEISERIVRNIVQYGEIPESLPLHITVYDDLVDIPEPLRNRVALMEPGVTELGVSNYDYHAALMVIPSSGQRIYVLYDTASIESTEFLQSFIMIGVAIAGGGVLFLGWMLARLVSNRILGPVSELAGVVQNIQPDEQAADLERFRTPDEVGALSEKIAQLLDRIGEFARREREFTSHASHELRTPLMVIKGAVEVVKNRSRDEDEKILKPLLRIERSIKDIEMLIETFLTLARQQQSSRSSEICHLKQIVRDVVSSHRYLIESKPVEVHVVSEGTEMVEAPSSFVTIAIGNLVRNAFQYTVAGKVDIVVSARSITVSDSGPGIDKNSRMRSGIGLTIVQRICENAGWEFSLISQPGQGTSATVIFHSRVEETPELVQRRE